MPDPMRKGAMRRGMLQKPKNTSQTLKKLWGYLRHYRVFLCIALLLVIVNIGASLFATSYMEPIINNFLQPPTNTLSTAERISGLMRGIGILATFFVVSSIAAYAQLRMMVYISQHTIHDVRQDLFSHLQKLSIRYFDTHTHGEIMSRFTNDVDTLNEALQNGITTLFSSSILLIGIFALMIARSIPLTILTILFAPLLLFAAAKVIQHSGKYFAAQQKSIGNVNSYIEEIMAGQKVVKVFGYEERAEENFAQRNEALRDAASTAQGLAGMMMPICKNMNSINFALVAMVGGILTTFGYLSIGALVVFLQLVQQYGRPVSELSGQFNAIITAIAGAERIFEVIAEIPEEEQDTPEYELKRKDSGWIWTNGVKEVAVRGDVQFKNVTFGYTPDKEILKNISLYAKPGHKIAFVGSTGAGKTTIINLLTRFYDVDQGQVFIDGLDIRTIARESLRNAMAVVLQDTHLFTGTVRENIRYGRLDATDEEVEQAAMLASAHSFIMRLPNGYDTLIEGDGANLSQGQRQLLNIARATVADAPILILDEATSSVDTRTERHIEHGMDRLMKNRTTFIIAHRLSTVRESNAIMVLEHGEIKERGTHDDLLKLHQRYYQLYTGALELD